MKDPAFLFYSQDFFTGVAVLNFEERGKYITLLCMMHQQGRLKEETIRFLVGSVSDNLKSKFRIDENGFWYNQRLEIETAKRNKFTESRRDNGLKGGRPKNEHQQKKPKQNHMVNHMGNHMGDENENENENEKRKGGMGEKPEITLPFSDQFAKLWQHWKDYRKKEHSFKYASIQSEQAAINNLVELSNGNEKTAREIVMQSMAQGWKGFFELKQNNKNGKSGSLPNQKERIEILDKAVDEFLAAKAAYEYSNG